MYLIYEPDKGLYKRHILILETIMASNDVPFVNYALTYESNWRRYSLLYHDITVFALDGGGDVVTKHYFLDRLYTRTNVLRTASTNSQRFSIRYKFCRVKLLLLTCARGRLAHVYNGSAAAARIV